MAAATQMPPIPLAVSVPVVDPNGDAGVVVEIDEDSSEAWVQHSAASGRLLRGGAWFSLSDLRVDDADPQGFAYALRVYTAARSETPLNGARLAVDMPRRGDSMLDRWLLGATTDHDRDALRRALAEVL